jgi:hypothetical protein
VKLTFACDPAYLEEIGASANDLEQSYLAHWRAESAKAGKMSVFARQTVASSTLGRVRLGYVTLIAQMIPQMPLHGLYGRSTRRSQFEVANDILAIATEFATSDAEQLQVGRTNWQLGNRAFELYLPDISTTYHTRAAQTYVRLRRWSEVATLYSNLGLSEAAAGYAGSAAGWLNLSAEVSRSLRDEQRAALTLSVSEALRREPSRFFAPSLQLRELMSSGRAAEGTLVEMYGLGLVALAANTPSMIASLQLADTVGDTLLNSLNEQWPAGAITAAAIDVRTVARILREPELLDDLEPRALEVLVAKLFEGFAAEVELTQETRDGGYDVGARFEVGDTRFRVLIEAKKWRDGRKVGISTVDRLMGVRHRVRADKVVLVTTSSFSTVARQAAAQMRCEIDLVDRGGLSAWVRQYLLPVEGSAIELPSVRIPSAGG